MYSIGEFSLINFYLSWYLFFPSELESQGLRIILGGGGEHPKALCSFPGLSGFLAVVRFCRALYKDKGTLLWGMDPIMWICDEPKPSMRPGQWRALAISASARILGYGCLWVLTHSWSLILSRLGIFLKTLRIWKIHLLSLNGF